MSIRAFAALVLGCTGLAFHIQASQSHQALGSRFAGRLTPSNGWQQTPRHPLPMPQAESWHCGAPVERGADRALGLGMPLDELYDQKLGWGRGRSYGTAHLATVPMIPDRVIVVGRFTGYDFVLTKSRFALFTQMYFDVERVLDQANASIGIGTHLTAIIEGGTVLLPNGRILQHDTKPKPFVPVPGHRYLLYLRHVAQGDFYLVAKSVEFFGGRAIPNSLDDVRSAESGTWPFLDQDEEIVLREIAEIIRQQKGKN